MCSVKIANGASDWKAYMIFLLHAFKLLPNELVLHKCQSKNFQKVQNGSRGRKFLVMHEKARDIRFRISRIRKRATAVVILSKLDFLFFGYYPWLRVNLSTSVALFVITNARIQKLSQYYVANVMQLGGSMARVKVPLSPPIINRRIPKGSRLSRIQKISWLSRTDSPWKILP